MHLATSRRTAAHFVLLAACAAAMLACQPGTGVPTAGASGAPAPLLGYSAETHGKLARPNYAVAFPQDKVPKFTIKVAPAVWQAMLDDMTTNFGARGSGGMGGMGGVGAPGGQRPARIPGGVPGAQPSGMASGAPAARPSGAPGVAPAGIPSSAAGDGPSSAPSGAPGAVPSGGASALPGAPGFNVGGPGGPGGMGGPSGSTWRPEWAEATIEYEGRAWEHVGLRFKGNSSLRSSWSSGSDKIPFKLDFNQFGDKHVATKEQRFHGFKQLALSANWSDAAAMRDTIVYDLLGDAGLPAAETAAYELVLDHGSGPVSLGLYTSIEVVDDTVVKRVFGDDKGNIYEGDGPAVSLAAGTRDRIAASYPKENNDGSDWSDLEALYDVLHDPLRKTDATAWRAKLEAIFDVDVFLRWLAIAAIVEHWDTYGGMTHNFYLYNSPATGKLTWISWDHNLVLGAMVGGAPGGMPPGGMALPEGFVPPAGFDPSMLPPGFDPSMLPPGMAPPAGLASAAPSGAPSATPSGGPSAVPSGGASAVPARRGGGGMGRNASLGKAEVTEAWPLIRFLLDEPRYYATYVSYLRETVNGPFEPTKMKAKYAKLGALYAPVAAATGTANYQAAVDALATATDARVKAVQDFLATPAAQVTVDPVVGPQ